MNFGYLIIVSTNSDFDYTKMAYALALSIKITQKPGYNNVAIVTDNVDKLQKLNSPWVFDQVINWSKEVYWDGRSWMDQLSPFDSTVCLDADMLFTRDCSHWIDYFVDNSELYIANRAFNYRNEVVKSNHYRKAFIENSLPNLYSFYSFFKKDNKLSADFFELSRWITKYPKEFSNTFLSDYKPKIIGTDEAFALSAKILGIEDTISYPLEFPRVAHMKGMVQDWPWPAEHFSDHVGFYVDKSGKIKIGSYLQTNIVHYVEKDKMTDEIVSILENVLWTKK